MRIKRFNAPDMRTALRTVREALGAEAVILSSRQSPDGVEVVAATDYDEVVVQQTLRSLGSEDTTATTRTPASTPSPDEFASVLRARIQDTTPKGRAVFPIGGEPAPAAPRRPAPASAPAAQSAETVPSRLEQVMAVLTSPRTPAATPSPAAPTAPQAAVTSAPASTPAQTSTADPPPLRAVETDPAMAALRAELMAMRKIIERELGQLAGERLRGSPARAAALDALAAFGCQEALAQDIAASLDPTLAPDALLGPLRQALAARIPVLPDAPLDTGGIVAVLGPTGAGKTTTIAKLAAQYAACHGARDVALVSADNARAGAREQLHVLGRRLGISVCDADGPDALTRVLDQLSDYPLVLIDTAGYGLRDRALLRQILWVRAASHVRSLLVLPANAHPADLDELLRRYHPAAPEGVVLTKLDETTRLGAALSVLIRHGLGLAYTSAGQRVPDDLALADACALTDALELPHRQSPLIQSLDDGQHALA